MDGALIVEEQELKERVLSKAIVHARLQTSISNLELSYAVDDYNIVRMRNENIRKEEYGLRVVPRRG